MSNRRRRSGVALSATEEQEIRDGLAAKARANLLPPPECPNPRCKADLTDPEVPPEYALFAPLFGLAREIPVDAETAAWLCPVCDHVWGKHARVTPDAAAS